MTNIELKSGIELPNHLLPLTVDCGLDLWLSNKIENWIRKTLRADIYTITINKDNDQCAIVLAFRELFPGIRLASGFPYSTILGDVELFWSNYVRVEKILKNQGVSRVELALAGEQPQRILTAHSKEYIDESYFSSLSAVRHIIDLAEYRHPQDLFSDLNSKLRWSIRKAEKNGVSVESIGPDSVEKAQDLYEQTMRDIQAPANYTIDRFELISHELSPKLLGNIYIAKCNSEQISMAAVLDSENTRHLIQIATPKRYRSTRVSDYLTWCLIKEAFELDKKDFDFMASSKDDQTLIEYKKKWNSRQEDILHVVLPINPVRSKIVDHARALNKALSANKFRGKK